VDNAKAGNCNGGADRFAIDRVLVDPEGNIVRRLQPGEHVRIQGHRVRLVPSEDEAKLEAVRYAFTRFDAVNISYRKLAADLNAKGYPSPGKGNGWTVGNLQGVLANPVYAGVSRWGARSQAKYPDVASLTKYKRPMMTREGKPIRRARGSEDAITRKGAYEGIVSVALFGRVQRKMEKRKTKRGEAKFTYPLSNLLVCSHCGLGMHGKTVKRTDRQGRPKYGYPQYVCQRYDKYGCPPNPFNETCHHHTVRGDRLEAWLIPQLQGALLGPGREELVREAKRQLKAEAKTNGTDTRRLERRLRELDGEIKNLVKAVRLAPDVAEVVQDLKDAKSERQALEGELRRASRLATPMDLDSEAEAVADEVWALGQAFDTADPLELRELFSGIIERVECRFEQVPTQSGGKRTQLVDGEVVLKDCGLFVLNGAHVTRP
jgi:hypothetical protein